MPKPIERAIAWAVEPFVSPKKSFVSRDRLAAIIQGLELAIWQAIVRDGRINRLIEAGNQLRAEAGYSKGGESAIAEWDEALAAIPPCDFGPFGRQFNAADKL